MGKKKSNKSPKKIKDNINFEEESEEIRNSRLATLIAIVAILTTIALFLFKCVKNIITLWPEDGYLYIILNWGIFCIPLAAFILIFIDIVRFVMKDLIRYDLKNPDRKKYSVYSDNCYAELISDFKIMIGVIAIFLALYGFIFAILQGTWEGILIISTYIFVAVVFLVIGIIEIKKHGINKKLIIEVVKKVGIFLGVLFIVFIFSLAGVTGKRDKIYASYDRDGLITLMGYNTDSIGDINFSINVLDGAEEVSGGIDEKDIFIANATKKMMYTNEKGDTYAKTQDLDGEKMYWKTFLDIKSFELKDGRYTITIMISQNNQMIEFENMFEVYGKQYNFATEKIDE